MKPRRHRSVSAWRWASMLWLAAVSLEVLGGVPSPPPPAAAAANPEASALFAAVRTGDRKALRNLLDGGADPSVKDDAGQTPLHLAAARGDWQAVSALVAKGADPSIRDGQGMTPLHKAALEGKAEAATVLLNRGAEPDPRDTAGLTPLHYAALHGWTAVANLLLDGGADPLAKDPTGLTPADMAKRAGKLETADLLRQAATSARAARRARTEPRPASPVRSYDDDTLLTAGSRSHGYTDGTESSVHAEIRGDEPAPPDGSGAADGDTGSAAGPVDRDWAAHLNEIDARRAALKKEKAAAQTDIPALEARLKELRDRPPVGSYGGHGFRNPPSEAKMKEYNEAIRGLENQIRMEGLRIQTIDRELENLARREESVRRRMP